MAFLDLANIRFNQAIYMIERLLIIKDFFKFIARNGHLIK